MALFLLFALAIVASAAIFLNCVDLAIKATLLFILLMVAFGMALVFLAIALVAFDKGGNKNGDSTDGSSK